MLKTPLREYARSETKEPSGFDAESLTRSLKPAGVLQVTTIGTLTVGQSS